VWCNQPLVRVFFDRVRWLSRQTWKRALARNHKLDFIGMCGVSWALGSISIAANYTGSVRAGKEISSAGWWLGKLSSVGPCFQCRRFWGLYAFVHGPEETEVLEIVCSLVEIVLHWRLRDTSCAAFEIKFNMTLRTYDLLKLIRSRRSLFSTHWEDT
jgi:hypothetical protein